MVKIFLIKKKPISVGQHGLFRQVSLSTSAQRNSGSDCITSRHSVDTCRSPMRIPDNKKNNRLTSIFATSNSSLQKPFRLIFF